MTDSTDATFVTAAADPTVSDKPITTSASAVPVIAQSLLAALMIVLGALPGLEAVLGTHNLIQIVEYVSGSAFIPVIGAATVLATIAWRAVQGWKGHEDKVTLLRIVPNAVGYVLGDPGTPSAPGGTILVAPAQ
jgi:hypothetical protein